MLQKKEKIMFYNKNIHLSSHLYIKLYAKQRFHVFIQNILFINPNKMLWMGYSCRMRVKFQVRSEWDLKICQRHILSSKNDKNLQAFQCTFTFVHALTVRANNDFSLWETSTYLVQKKHLMQIR